MNPKSVTNHIQRLVTEQMHYSLPVLSSIEGLVGAEPFAGRLREVVDTYSYTSSPYLESIPFYRQDDTTSLQQMADTGLIEQETARVFARFFGCSAGDARLYKHQVASTEAVKNGENLIVCTGTGSGKTESFLVPVLDAVIRERKEKGEAYQPGVRTMLLYPMNALVNDQLKRIREILKGAEAEGIPYAKDITYGIYTGDVDTLKQEAAQEAERLEVPARMQECVNAAEKDSHDRAVRLKHPYLSEDDSSPREYVTRSRWEIDGGADLLITNYSMLEQMLLNPWRNSLFQSGTWRFIVLDEAHSYDGAMGTEISWLLRRLQHRVGSQIQYLATSATLFPEDKTIQNPLERRVALKKRIQEEYAEKFFPSTAGTPLSIQLGEVYQPVFIAGAKEADFSLLCREESEVPLSNQLLSNPLKQHYALREGNRGLVAQTAWLLEWKQYLKKADRAFTVDKKKEVQALGDAVVQVQQVAQLGFNEQLGWRPQTKATWKALKALLMDADISAQDKATWVGEVSGKSNKTEVEALLRALVDFVDSEGKGKLHASHFLYLAYLANRCVEKLRFEEGSAPDPLCWPVLWDDDYAVAMHYQLSELRWLQQQLTELENLLVARWQSLCGSAAETDLHRLMTEFVQQTPAMKRLADALEGVEEHPEHRTVENIANIVFPEKTNPEDELDAFIRLLSMTRLPEMPQKPLMDLRYHQLASGLSSLSIAFSDSEDVRVYADDDRIYDDSGNLLFTMGLCYDCGHPYILFYSDEENLEHECNCSRYETSADRYRHAVSWICNPDAEKNDNYALWLNYRTGKLCMHTKPEGEPVIQVYHLYNWGNGRACPICGGKAKTQAATDSVITDYKTGEDTLRSILLESLIVESDIPATGRHKVGSGRKLLAFSDSRSRAAKLNTEFERYSLGRLLEYGIWDAFRTVSQMDAPTFEKCIKAYAEECGQLPKVDFLGDIQWETSYWGNSLMWKCIKNQKADFLRMVFRHSLPAMAACLHQRLTEAQATQLLNQEMPNGTVYENATDSVILSAMSELRRRGRHNLFRDGNITLSALKVDLLQDPTPEAETVLRGLVRSSGESPESFSSSWQAYVREAGELLAIPLFNEILLFLFQKVRLDTEGITAQSFRYTEGETMRERVLPINAYYPLRRVSYVSKARMNNCIPFVTNEKPSGISRIVTQKGFSTERSRVILSRLFDFMEKAHILEQEATVQGAYRLKLAALSFHPQAKEPRERIGDYFRIEEHTAQLTTARGRLYQQMFAAGEINILSCSTTFEMGVDLGNLNCVFMANMPPSVANYRQRAGRAGRRAGASAYVLTCIGNASHDRHYKDCPEKLFFGRVKEPLLYPENKSYRARHLRAVALHHFLCYLKEERLPNLPKVLERSWDRPNCFFGKEMVYGSATCYAQYLKAWAEAKADEVNALCRAITGGEDPGYSVAADLCYQLIGEEEIIRGVQSSGLSPEYYKSALGGLSQEMCLMLGGPHLPDAENSYWRSCIMHRYNFDNGRGRSQTIPMLLARSRVLPRYGFPCDVAVLRQDAQDHDQNRVELSRDLRQAIFEYAPGHAVYADKGIYTSRCPVEGPAGHVPQLDALYRCEACSCRFISMDAEPNKCPECAADIGFSRVLAVWPVAFRSKPRAHYATYIPTAVANRKYAYTGGVGALWTPQGLNLAIYSSPMRQILYCNPDVTYKPLLANDRDGEAQTRDLVHFVHTDILLWALRAPALQLQGLSARRCANAWQSAMQAVLKAVARVLCINERDIAGMLHTEQSRTFMVLFDNTPGGSGALLPLLHAKDNAERNAKADLLSEEILREALNICGGGESSPCTCYRQGAEHADCQPVSHTEYLQLAEEAGGRVREHYSCYRCLKSYDNQQYHTVLDAYEAGVVLRAMLGEIPLAAPSEDMPEVRPPAPDKAPSPADRMQERRKMQLLKKLQEGTRCMLVVLRDGVERTVRSAGGLCDNQLPVVDMESRQRYTVNVDSIIREQK